MMYSGLDDTTKRRMMQAKALSMEAKGGWWKSVQSLFNHAVYCYNSLLIAFVLACVRVWLGVSAVQCTHKNGGQAAWREPPQSAGVEFYSPSLWNRENGLPPANFTPADQRHAQTSKDFLMLAKEGHPLSSKDSIYMPSYPRNSGPQHSRCPPTPAWRYLRAISDSAVPRYNTKRDLKQKLCKNKELVMLRTL